MVSRHINVFRKQIADLAYSDAMNGRLLFKSSLLSLLICASTSSLAQSPIDQIIQLNAAGRSAEAYQLSMQMLPEYEGDPSFDVHYGVSAVDTGNASEGAFALERVLMNQPNNDYARLELGRAYFALEEDDRAEEHFNQVLAANPPEDVVDNVKPYLSAIDARRSKRETTFIANVSVGGGYDSNILAAPDEDTFFIPLLGSTASLGTNELSDSFYQLSADATVSHPIRYGTNIVGSVLVNQRQNDSDLVDILSFGARAGISHEQGAELYRLTFEADTLEVDSRGYRDSYGLSASWKHAWNPTTSFTASAQFSQLSYDDQVFKDALLATGGFSVQHQFIAPLRPVANIGVFIGKENADNPNLSGALQNTERDIAGLNASLRLTLRPDLQMTASFDVRESSYAEAGLNATSPSVTSAPTFTDRDDTQYTGRIGFAWQAMDKLLLKLDGSLGQNDSSIGIYEYDRNQVVFSMRYTYR